MPTIWKLALIALGKYRIGLTHTKLTFSVATTVAATPQGEGNSVCAKWCKDNCPDHGKCTSDAAKGGGYCYECGPKKPNTKKSWEFCKDKCCDTYNDKDNCGKCGNKVSLALFRDVGRYGV